MTMKVDLTPDSLDLVYYAGDSGDFQMEFVDDAGTKLDVSTWAWEAQIRKSRTADIFASLNIDTSQAVHGLLTIHIPGTVTRLLAQRAWDKVPQWDIQGTLGGADPLTVLQGTILCNMDVTR